jgi:5'-nucleotidase
MTRILVTNDDGVHSDGIHSLAAALAGLGDVTIVAPHIEASAIGHALTLRRPLRMERLRDHVYEVDGTPTDCVNIAITQVYTPGNAPDLVVSGMRGDVVGARTFLNINVPPGKPKGLRVTVQAKRNHITIVDRRTDPRGQPYYWIEEGENDWEPHDRSDYQAVRDGYVSVTPLQPDLTDYSALTTLEQLALDLPALT